MFSWGDDLPAACNTCGGILVCRCPPPPREYAEAVAPNPKPTPGCVPRPQTCPKHLRDLICEDCAQMGDPCPGEDEE